MPTTPATHKPHKTKTKRHNVAEIQRGTSAERGYGHRWRKARAGYLRKHPLCVMCQLQGGVTVATDLDHRIPHRGDKALFWDSGNWQPMCKPCHSAKTAREDGGFGNERHKR